MYLVNYGLKKSQATLIKKQFKKWSVKNMSGSLSLTNLPPKDCQILTIHTDSVVTGDIVKKLPNLKLIIARTAGYDHIDLSACKRFGVQVVNCPGLNAVSVAEFTVTLMLGMYRKLVAGAKAGLVMDFNDPELTGMELAGKTLGVVGTGAIGARVAQIAKGFGMEIVGHDHHKNKDLIKHTNIKYMSLKQVFGRSDIVSLHVPATPMTENLVNNQLLAHAKKGLLLINTARGSVVSEKALLRALNSGKLSGYAADVLEHEAWMTMKSSKLTPSQRQIVVFQKLLAKHSKVLFTPHIAHATIESAERIFRHTIELISAFGKGQKIKTII